MYISDIGIFLLLIKVRLVTWGESKCVLKSNSFEAQVNYGICGAFLCSSGWFWTLSPLPQLPECWDSTPSFSIIDHVVPLHTILRGGLVQTRTPTHYLSSYSSVLTLKSHLRQNKLSPSILMKLDFGFMYNCI